MNTFQVQVVRRGLITLPKKLRESNRIEDGDILTLIDMGDGVFILSPLHSRVDTLADRLADDWVKSGETLESMLQALHEVREEYATKKP